MEKKIILLDLTKPLVEKPFNMSEYLAQQKKVVANLQWFKRVMWTATTETYWNIGVLIPWVLIWKNWWEEFLKIDRFMERSRDIEHNIANISDRIRSTASLHDTDLSKMKLSDKLDESVVWQFERSKENIVTLNSDHVFLSSADQISKTINHEEDHKTHHKSSGKYIMNDELLEWANEVYWNLKHGDPVCDAYKWYYSRIKNLISNSWASNDDFIEAYETWNEATADILGISQAA